MNSIKRLAATTALALTLISSVTTPAAAYQGDTYTDLIQDETLTDQHAVIIRFYAAVFGRTPDNDGVRFWLDQYDTGEWSTRRIADFFATSDEFVDLYGDDTTNEAFVDSVYPNVLGRTPDVDGRTFWINYLAQGNPRAEMILLVSNAPEFIHANELPFEGGSTPQPEPEPVTTDCTIDVAVTQEDNSQVNGDSAIQRFDVAMTPSQCETTPTFIGVVNWRAGGEIFAPGTVASPASLLNETVVWECSPGEQSGVIEWTLQGVVTIDGQAIVGAKTTGNATVTCNATPAEPMPIPEPMTASQGIISAQTVNGELVPLSIIECGVSAITPLDGTTHSVTVDDPFDSFRCHTPFDGPYVPSTPPGTNDEALRDWWEDTLCEATPSIDRSGLYVVTTDNMILPVSQLSDGSLTVELHGTDPAGSNVVFLSGCYPSDPGRANGLALAERQYVWGPAPGPTPVVDTFGSFTERPVGVWNEAPQTTSAPDFYCDSDVELSFSQGEDPAQRVPGLEDRQLYASTPLQRVVTEECGNFTFHVPLRRDGALFVDGERIPMFVDNVGAIYLPMEFTPEVLSSAEVFFFLTQEMSTIQSEGGRSGHVQARYRVRVSG